MPTTREDRMAGFRAAVEAARNGDREPLLDAVIKHAELAALVEEYRAAGDEFGYSATKEFLNELGTFVVANQRPDAVPGGTVFGVDRSRAPPLVPFEGWLKQIRPEALDPLGRFALSVGFPLFLGAHDSIRIEKGPDPTARDYCRRRFSGDTHAPLSRGRYHALCMDEQGDDNATLISEMNSYTLPHVTGVCIAGRSITHDSVCLTFRGLPGEPNPLYLAATDDSIVNELMEGNRNSARNLIESKKSLDVVPPDGQEERIYVDCTVSREAIPAVLDLRQMEARDWLVDFLARPPNDYFGVALRHLASINDLDLAIIKNWWEAAALIGGRTYGGNAYTDLLGAYLRNAGVDALIFPSARNDYFAAWQDGSLGAFYGWNLVDYRGSNPPREFLPQPTTLYPLTVLETLEIREGENAGSIGLKGNLEDTKATAEQSYLTFVMTKGLDAWRRNNHKMDLQGFYWFKRRYSLPDSSFYGTCARCEFAFTDVGLRLQQSCPHCSYPGEYF
jgi:hypothetical protein